MYIDDIAKYEELGCGSTAKVYLDRKNGKCIKIFKNLELAEREQKKIEFMQGISKLRTREELSWPEECVYDAGNHFIGYQMKKAPKGESLSRYYNTRLYQLNTHNITKLAYDFMDICKNIHDAGMLIVDFNPNNFIITETGRLFMIDTDNFQFRTSHGEQYKAEVACSMYLDKHLQKIIGEGIDLGHTPSEIIHDCPYETFNLKTELFGMAALIFQLFMNGKHPFSGRYNGEDSSIEVNIYHDYSPYFGKGNRGDLGVGSPDIRILPKGLVEAFREIFFTDFDPEKKERQLMNEIVNYDKKLTANCRENHNHYYIGDLAKCPWCELNRIKDASIMKDLKERLEKSENGIPEKTVSSISNQAIVNTGSKPYHVQSACMNISTPANRNNNYNGNPTVKPYSGSQANRKQKEQSSKSTVLWVVFAAVCACQIYAFGAGYIGKFYASNVGESGNLIVLGGLAKYLLLIAGIIISVGVTVAFSHCSFTVGPAVLLDVGTQVALYFALLWVVALFVSIASIALIIIIIGGFGYIFAGA